MTPFDRIHKLLVGQCVKPVVVHVGEIDDRLDGFGTRPSRLPAIRRMGGMGFRQCGTVWHRLVKQSPPFVDGQPRSRGAASHMRDNAGGIHEQVAPFPWIAAFPIHAAMASNGGTHIDRLPAFRFQPSLIRGDERAPEIEGLRVVQRDDPSFHRTHAHAADSNIPRAR